MDVKLKKKKKVNCGSQPGGWRMAVCVESKRRWHFSPMRDLVEMLYADLPPRLSHYPGSSENEFHGCHVWKTEISPRNETGICLLGFYTKC